jgi:hypothetical protein
MVSSYFTGARNRAMQTGRPVGVWLDRLQGMNDACVAMSYAEVPTPYAGDSNSSFVTTTYVGAVPYIAAFTPYDSGGVYPSSDIGWTGTIRIGDMIRFNLQGPYYQIATPQNPNAYDATTGLLQLDPATSPPMGNPAFNLWPLIIPSGTVTSPPNTGLGTVGVRYQIVRAPVKSAAGAMQLPGPIVIDMSFSGFDLPNGMYDPSVSIPAPPGIPTPISPWVWSSSFQPVWPRAGVNMSTVSNNYCPFTNTNRSDVSPVIITFNPSGGIDAVWSWANVPVTVAGYGTNPNPIPIPVTPTTPIHLLVGKRELLPLPNTPPAITNPNDPKFQPYANWQDLTNFWITINPQSGMVTVVENAASTTAMANNGYLNGGFGSFVELMEARQLALQSMRVRGQ